VPKNVHRRPYDPAYFVGIAQICGDERSLGSVLEKTCFDATTIVFISADKYRFRSQARKAAYHRLTNAGSAACDERDFIEMTDPANETDA
jgi:hypothetical protein